MPRRAHRARRMTMPVPAKGEATGPQGSQAPPAERRRESASGAPQTPHSGVEPMAGHGCVSCGRLVGVPAKLASDLKNMQEGLVTHRTHEAPELPAVDLSPPVHLTGEAAVVWRQTIEAMSMCGDARRSLACADRAARRVACPVASRRGEDCRGRRGRYRTAIWRRDGVAVAGHRAHRGSAAWQDRGRAGGFTAATRSRGPGPAVDPRRRDSDELRRRGRPTTA